MEALTLMNNVEVGKASPKREFRLTKVRNLKSFVKSNNGGAAHILEAIGQGRSNGVSNNVDEGGVMRVKLVVKKQELKQILEGVMKISSGNKRINSGNKVHPIGRATSMAHSLSAEQKLNLLWRRKFLKTMDSWSMDGGRRGRCWQPALQSIPEEFHVHY